MPVNAEPRGDAGTATGSSVIDLSGPQVQGSLTQNGALICPYGIGSDDTTFSVRLIGWRVIGWDTAGTLLWIPVTLCELLCTLGTSVGVAGAVVLDTERFADVLTLTTGNANVSIDIISPANNTIGHVLADLKGFQKMELSFQTGSSATSCNALFALL